MDGSLLGWSRRRMTPARLAANPNLPPQGEPMRQKRLEVSG
jgi:hypothetical protein